LANLFIAESPAASIGVCVGRGGADFRLAGVAVSLIRQHDYRGR